MPTNSDRDQAIEHLLRHSGAADPAPGGRGPCLDAETLAAWADGGLPPHVLATAEAHASECARCQAMVAVLLKQPPAVQAAEDRRASRWSLGWLVPLAAGVAAVGLWFAVPQPAKLADAPRPGTPPQRAAQAAPVPAPPSSALVDRMQPVQPQAAAGAGPATPADARLKAATEANEPPRAESANAQRRDEFVAGARPAEERQRSAAPASQDAVGRLDAEPPTAPLPAPAAAAPRAAPAAATPAATAAPARAMASLRETVAVQVASPDPSIRWRIGAGGSVEYSANGGATWERQASGVAVDLTAGSSPSPTVCWLVGAGGTVLRTTDGRRWQRVAFPETVDLVSVQAPDASTASVTAAGGRVFRTSDSGKTWQ